MFFSLCLCVRSLQFFLFCSQFSFDSFNQLPAVAVTAVAAATTNALVDLRLVLLLLLLLSLCDFYSISFHSSFLPDISLCNELKTAHQLLLCDHTILISDAIDVSFISTHSHIYTLAKTSKIEPNNDEADAATHTFSHTATAFTFIYAHKRTHP